VENIKPFESSELATLIDKYSPFFKEIRKRLIATIAVFLVATIAGFAFYEQIIKLLVDALSLKGINIVFTSPFQFINLAIDCGLVSGLVMVFPFFIFQVVHFLKPALRGREFKMLVGLLPFSLILFIFGFAFGALIMKWQIEIFLARSVALGIGNILDVSSLLYVVLLTSALMGIGFQFPIVLLLLMRIGIIKPHHLSKNRQWVYLGSFIFAILLPPDSILADILLTLPLVILFEITLLLNHIFERNRLKADSIS
jgi:sec-independent protein translocase protein TatC